MFAALREASFVWPMIAAVTLAALVMVCDASPSGALFAMVGTVGNKLADDVRRVREDVMRELERLRLVGLSLPTATSYLAEKLGLNSDALALSHFSWRLERHGVDDQPRPSLEEVR